MITFYQWNKTFRTLGYSKKSALSPYIQKLVQKSDDLLINGYKKQSRKSCKQKALRQHIQHKQKLSNIEIKDELKEMQVSPFKNIAIRQKIKTISPQKDDKGIRTSLKISKINIDECELPVKRLLDRKIQQSCVYSGRRKSKIFNHHSLYQINSHRPSTHKYQNLSEQKNTDSNFLVNRKSLLSQSNNQNKLKILSSILDRFKLPNKRIANQTLLSKFIKYQKKIQQTNTVDQLKHTKQYSSMSNKQQQTIFLLPSRRKSYRKDQNENKSNRYRRSISNYKTVYQDAVKDQNHKKYMHSISISWSNLALNQ